MIVAIQILSHLPLASALERMAEAVRPGGCVLIADRFDPRGVAEIPYNGLSWLLRRSSVDDSDGERLPLRVIRATLRRVLPGVTVRRHLGARYTACWQKR